MITLNRTLSENAIDNEVAQPIYFGPQERRLFGWFHPASGASSRPAVVLCKPVGAEMLYLHATYRYLAERLAAAGYPTLRFDYDGTGDSFGDDTDPDRVESWLHSIDHAVHEAQDRTGRRVLLFGVRLGGTLATIAASRREDIAGLALWAPFRNGKSCLREMRALAIVNKKPDPSQIVGDNEEIGGFVFTPQTIASLMELDGCKIEALKTERILLISRDDLPAEKHFARHLNELGVDVTSVDWPGYAGMMREPQDVTVPIEAIDSLIHHLNTAYANENKVQQSRSEWVFSSNRLQSGEFIEQPMFRQSDGGGFGILTRPSSANERTRTGVFLLSIGANSHIGASRLYVPLARRLANLGFTVFRSDAPCTGDNADGPVSGRDNIYSPATIEDMQKTIADIRKQANLDEVILIGLCSGAYTAYKVSIQEKDIRALVLINLLSFDWKEGDSLETAYKTVYYRRTSIYFDLIRKGKTWKRILNREIDFAGIMATLASRTARTTKVALQHIVSLLTRFRPYETDVCQVFQKHSARGTDTFFLFSSGELGIDLVGTHLGPFGKKIRKHFHFQIIRHADHTFTGQRQREEMYDRIVNHLSALIPTTQAMEVTDKRFDPYVKPENQRSTFARIGDEEFQTTGRPR